MMKNPPGRRRGNSTSKLRMSARTDANAVVDDDVERIVGELMLDDLRETSAIRLIDAVVGADDVLDAIARDGARRGRQRGSGSSSNATSLRGWASSAMQRGAAARRRCPARRSSALRERRAQFDVLGDEIGWLAEREAIDGRRCLRGRVRTRRLADRPAISAGQRHELAPPATCRTCADLARRAAGSDSRKSGSEFDAGVRAARGSSSTEFAGRGAGRGGWSSSVVIGPTRLGSSPSACEHGLRELVPRHRALVGDVPRAGQALLCEQDEHAGEVGGDRRVAALVGDERELLVLAREPQDRLHHVGAVAPDDPRRAHDRVTRRRSRAHRRASSGRTRTAGSSCPTRRTARAWCRRTRSRSRR